MADTRYPYTYACDFIRAIPEPTSTGVVLSRGDASLIISHIAEVLGMEHEQLAVKLAKAELSKTAAEIEHQAQRTLRALGL